MNISQQKKVSRNVPDNKNMFYKVVFEFIEISDIFEKQI